MKQLFKLVFLLGLISVCGVSQAFIIRDITVQGNDRISRSTILNYLPIKVGQKASPPRIQQALKSLYSTKFFSTVELARKGNNLVVIVHERPIIGSISYSGNSMIPKDRIDKALKDSDLVRGHVFDKGALERIKKSLQSAYVEHGRYNASINVNVSNQQRNRVAIFIAIDEGAATKIKEIKIIGNHHFSFYRLTQGFDMTTSRPWSIITGGNKYNTIKLRHDVASLRQFYLNHGYVRFKVDSFKATLSDDKKWAHIIIHITEGPRYTFTCYKLMGKLLGGKAALLKRIDLEPNTPYSQKLIEAAQKSISRFFGDRAYIGARVKVIPEIDDSKHTVSVVFHVLPGERVYVRRILFNGNSKTADNVLRRELRQMEGAPVHTSNIDRSMRNLRVLGYLKDVNMRMAPVPNTTDEVDLLVHVKEYSSSQASISGGYGSNGVGLVFGASLNQPNFLGTGNSIGINFKRDQYQREYSFDYLNPYITMNGISRGFHFYSHRTTPSRINLGAYSLDKLGGYVNYRYPLSDYSGVNFSLGLEKLKLNTRGTPSNVIATFLRDNNNRRLFRYGTASLGWDYNSYDQVPFTTKGWKHSLSINGSFPVSGAKLEYYKVNYLAHGYYPITRNTIFSISADLGYGSSYGATHGGLPFFQNYLAGGFDTVRGFEYGSLGPKDSTNKSLGGNLLAAGTLAIIFPNPISDNLRTSVFLDGGNVFRNRINFGDMRYSTGVSAIWRMPMLGVIQVAFAKTLKKRAGDETKFFDFTFGTSF